MIYIYITLLITNAYYRNTLYVNFINEKDIIKNKVTHNQIGHTQLTISIKGSSLHGKIFMLTYTHGFIQDRLYQMQH